MARYKPFKCINCGAVISWDRDATEAVCDYCGTAVPAQALAAARRGRSAKGLVIAIIAGSFGLVLVGMLVFGLVFMRACDKGMDATRSMVQVDKVLEQAKRAPGYNKAHERLEREREARRRLRRHKRAAPSAQASSEHFQQTLAFGEKGQGPGQLDDPRQITADREGRIYVADYFTLRVQVFDNKGAFIRTIQLDRGRKGHAIHGLALDHAGHLYVSRSGDLLKIRLDGDKVVRTLRSRRGIAYGDVAVTAAGAIYVQNLGAMTFISRNGRRPNKDNLRKLSRRFKLLRRWKADEAASGAIAVDGVGNVVIAGRFTRRIDMLDSAGKLAGRIPLGRRAFPRSVALDGKGRIFLTQRGSVKALDRSGKELFDLGDHNARDVNLGQDGQLYVVTARERVLRFKLK